jgi:hypothetical protein
MSGHVRFGFAAFLLVAGFATPAASNVFTDLFSSSPAPEAATAAPAPAAAPAVAPDQCLRQPGPATSGGRWVYRYDGHRKCWFQAEAGAAVAKRPSRSHLVRRRVTAPEQSESAPPRPHAAEDARAELTNAAPAETPEPAPSAPKLTVVRTIPVHLADAAAQVPPAPPAPGADQATTTSPAPPPVDVERLLAEAPAANEEVASAAAATPISAPGASMGGGEEATAPWLGVLLIALGGAALLGSSRTLRRALWPPQIADAGTELPATAHGGRSDPSFAAPRIRLAGAGRDELLEFDPHSVAPLVHAVPTRRTVAPEPPSEEALWEEGIGALAALAGPVSPEAFSGRRAMARGMERRRRASG